MICCKVGGRGGVYRSLKCAMGNTHVKFKSAGSWRKHVTVLNQYGGSEIVRACLKYFTVISCHNYTCRSSYLLW